MGTSAIGWQTGHPVSQFVMYSGQHLILSNHLQPVMACVICTVDKPIRVPGIDVDVQIVFVREHLSLLLPHIDKTGVPRAAIDEMINAYIASGEVVAYERWILEYGQRVLNPLMNQKLGRPADHPTFNNLLKYALKDEIEKHPTIVELRKFRKV